MSFSFKLRSHRKESESYEDGQLLVEHLQGVRDIAIKTSRMHGISGNIEKIIEILCMCHDFGKASNYFQKYLKKEYNKDRKDHGEISAYFAYYMLPEEWKLIGFMCIKRHHGNLEPDINFFDYKKDKLSDIAISIKENIIELNQIYKQDISDFFQLIQDDNFLKEPRRLYRNKHKKFTIEDFVWTQYLWSSILTGDKTQLIRGEAYQNKINIYEKYVYRYKEKVRKALIGEIPEIEETELFKIRNQIYEEVIRNIDKVDLKKQHLFSINVPTGTGKTLSVYAAAFKLLERIYKESNKTIMPSIIYNIPFTSVIDQNYDVLEKILKTNDIECFESLILKHHSMTELNYTDHNEKLDEAKEYKNYDARFCVENWQSTIITTTFVQLFNTIFQAGVNSITNRFHKLAGSIIILDEVQAIPPKYYDIIEEVFHVLCKKFNCYVITVTATKPLFLIGEELVKSNEEIFKKLDRIQIENHTVESKTLNGFFEIVIDDVLENEDKSFLIVLNTVKSSLNILEKLRKPEVLKKIGREVLYLSTEIYPKRRLEIINQIKNDKKKKYIVVSTQLIEAGVDLDFDVVYRDFSTIDSINQTAGRANRNAVKGKGIVKLFSLINENHNDKKFARYIYPDTLLDVTEKIIKGKEIIKEKDIFDINKAYFKAVLDKRGKDQSKELKDAISKIDFKKVKKLFKLIDKDYQKEDIIINQNEETQEKIDLIEVGTGSYQEVINAWRFLNQFRVSVNKSEMGNINSNTIIGVNILDEKYYDVNKGIIRTSIIQC